MRAKVKGQRAENKGRKAKNEGQRIKPVLCALCSVLIFFLCPLPFDPVHAANPIKKLSEIQQKLIDELGKVKEAEKNEGSILTKIEEINNGIKKKEEELRRYERRISQTQSEINNLSEEIDALKSQLGNRKQYFEDHINALYKQQYGGNALILISAEDYQDLIKRSRYLSLVAYHDSKILNKYSIELQEISLKKKEMEVLHENLNADKEYARGKERELQTERRKKAEMLASVRGKRISSENNIKELEESSRNLQDMISGLKTKEIPKVVLGDGFNSLKKNLPWPVDGKVLVPYGKYEDPVFNKLVVKNGIEIEAKLGETPKAIAGGRVIYADKFEAYGMLLVIDHGNGYNSVYGNLAETQLVTGDILIKGMDIGKVNKSRLFNTPTLYFEIRYKGRPVDPMEWLGSKG
ncbi:MAG: peptidoglycan DD-metalloendopeptidase family protein [Nitrospirae bacterium]|nr:peptidoglycan DD-metalloendopeptidase family protein [Nitrospirota bacterium]